MISESAIARESAGRGRPLLLLAIAAFLVVSCVSSVYVVQLYPSYHIAYDPGRHYAAAIAVGLFAPVFLLFVVAEFSFGYVVGFYLAAMIAGYLWLSFFSVRIYDHEAARISAAASALIFLLPVLFVTSPLPRAGGLSVKSFERLLAVIFLICLATVAAGATYNFRFVSPGQASALRTDALPRILNYLVPITSGALLPFLFAYLVARKAFWRAAAVIALMLCYYPVAVSKTALFAPAWLIFMAVLCRIFGARMAVVLSLLLPIAAGVLLLLGLGQQSALSPGSYFFNVNFRLLAVPSLAMDIYNEFFASHPLTHFCQIGLLKPIIGCPYNQQLGLLMQDYFPGGGTYNGSLFATEGIASVGLLYAPVTAFVCGLVIAVGNRASAGLPPSFVLVSGAVLIQILLNVPLSTVLLSHGGALLFLLWYLTPREAFSENAG
jgi:hypothetical protein